MRRSPQLARQWKLYDQDAHERALQQARALLPRLHGPERREAQRLIGLCHLRQNKGDEAVDWLKRACEGSDNSQLWLELALAALKAGDRELSEEAFEQVRLCQQVARYAQAPGFYLQLFWYAGSLLDPLPRPKSGDAWARAKLDINRQRQQARQLLDELAAVYRRLYLTDTTFLYARRMPFLSSFLTLAKHYFLLQDQRDEGRAWLQELAQGLDRQGQEQVRLAAAALRRRRKKRPQPAAEPEST